MSHRRLTDTELAQRGYERRRVGRLANLPDELTARAVAEVETLYPGVSVTPPGEQCRFWMARRDGKILASEPGLLDLLADLARLLPADGEAS